MRFDASASSSKENFDHAIRWTIFSENPYGQSLSKIFMSPTTPNGQYLIVRSENGVVTVNVLLQSRPVMFVNRHTSNSKG